jgi:Flp pilus assembly pilin Flp
MTRPDYRTSTRVIFATAGPQGVSLKRQVPLKVIDGVNRDPISISDWRQGQLRSQEGGHIVLHLVRHYLNLLATTTGKGQGLVEYALIIVLISIVSIVIMTTLGGSISSVFSSANTALTAP